MLYSVTNPRFWGKHGWIFLISIAYNYPNKPTNDDKTYFYNFYHNLQNVLPCNACRNNFKSHIKKYPLCDNVLKSRTNLITWLFKIRNCVDKSIGVKEYTNTDFLKELQNFYLNENKIPYVFYLFPMLMVTLILVYHFKIKKLIN
jgi:hypothetical protein